MFHQIYFVFSSFVVYTKILLFIQNKPSILEQLTTLNWPYYGWLFYMACWLFDQPYRGHTRPLSLSSEHGLTTCNNKVFSSLSLSVSLSC